jgi:hypothetical protein
MQGPPEPLTTSHNKFGPAKLSEPEAPSASEDLIPRERAWMDEGHQVRERGSPPPFLLLSVFLFFEIPMFL